MANIHLYNSYLHTYDCSIQEFLYLDPVMFFECNELHILSSEHAHVPLLN